MAIYQSCSVSYQTIKLINTDVVGIHGSTDLQEVELNHLDGYRSSKPVRIGNGAATHLQLDIYGELLDAVYLYNKHGSPISYSAWLSVRELADHVCKVWDKPD